MRARVAPLWDSRSRIRPHAQVTPFQVRCARPVWTLLHFSHSPLPVQVSFLGEGSLDIAGFWFATERIVDALFGLDVLVNLNTAVWRDPHTRGVLECDRRVIVVRACMLQALRMLC